MKNTSISWLFHQIISFLQGCNWKIFFKGGCEKSSLVECHQILNYGDFKEDYVPIRLPRNVVSKVIPLKSDDFKFPVKWTVFILNSKKRPSPITSPILYSR